MVAKEQRLQKLRKALEKTYTLIGEDLIADSRGEPRFCDPTSRRRFERMHRDLGRTLGVGKR